MDSPPSPPSPLSPPELTDAQIRAIEYARVRRERELTS